MCSSVGTLAGYVHPKPGAASDKSSWHPRGPYDFATILPGVSGRLQMDQRPVESPVRYRIIGIPFFIEIEATERNRRSTLPYSVEPVSAECEVLPPTLITRSSANIYDNLILTPAISDQKV